MKKKLIITILLVVHICIAIFCSACSRPASEEETFTVTYYTENGIISGDNPQIVQKGVAAMPINAVPDYGYEFVRWSDGLETSSRFDFNIQSDKNLYAEMRKRQYTLNYHADMGGKIKRKKSTKENRHDI